MYLKLLFCIFLISGSKPCNTTRAHVDFKTDPAKIQPVTESPLMCYWLFGTASDVDIPPKDEPGGVCERVEEERTSGLL